MKHPETNRFQDFFEEGKYTILKNYLYNYLLRKRAVEKSFENEIPDLILEMGSGISPIITRSDRIIYSDVSHTALKMLRSTLGKGAYVVADGMCLPFKSGVFSHAVYSEVLEHLEDDRKALKEMARVMKTSGHAVITFPHRKFYFANDDRFVRHFRRYELDEMLELLMEAGLKPIYIQKVLGPLEKLTMCIVVFCYDMIQRLKSGKVKKTRDAGPVKLFAPFFKIANRIYMGLTWLDARIMPRAFSTVLLIKAEKKNRDVEG